MGDQSWAIPYRGALEYDSAMALYTPRHPRLTTNHLIKEGKTCLTHQKQSSKPQKTAT